MPILEKQGYTFEATELTLQYADEAIADGDVDSLLNSTLHIWMHSIKIIIPIWWH